MFWMDDSGGTGDSGDWLHAGDTGKGAEHDAS